MFFQLLFIHLFRPFLKYKQTTSPLPSNISPRKFLVHSAATISKLLRLYKRTYGLRQICNIVVYIAHSACTIHLLTLPDKNAARDIVHGLNQLEEIAERWLCARRTLGILHTVSKRWNIELPEGAEKTLQRVESKFGTFKASDHDTSPKAGSPQPMHNPPQPLQQSSQVTNLDAMPFLPAPGYLPNTTPFQSPSSASHSHSSSLTLPPQSASDFGKPSHQHSYVIPQASRRQHEAWQRPPGTQANAMTSPTMIFGGVQSLMQDQEWWLWDSNQFFANWNGVDHGQGGELEGIGIGIRKGLYDHTLGDGIYIR